MIQASNISGQDEDSELQQTFAFPDLTFSVCAASDLQVWQQTSRNLLKFVPSKNYAVIVPDEEVHIFRTVTDRKFSVIPESAYVGALQSRLAKKMPTAAIGRLGWYLQQFIKLAVLKEARSDENYLIWDADTVPLRKIGFFEHSGKVQFYIGTESHSPYFEFTRKLLGLGKIAPFSFIAQCFPCKGVWANSFFEFIENKFNATYLDTIIELVDFEELSGFSEYETLGSFILSMFPEQLEIKNSNWLRNGSGLVGGTENLDAAPFNQLMNGFDHVTFERWEEPFSILKNQNPEFTKQFFEIAEAARPKLDDYLDRLFRENQVRAVCQIGANDGIQNDPLRNYLSSPGAYRATLVEPIPYYAEKLRTLYTGRPDIHIVQAAAGATENLQNFYFIPPSLAAEMNGDGPKNDWAHGQGSFYKESVVHWIKANGFRGPHYVSQIDNYINSIATIEIPTVKTEQVLPRDRVGLLLLIDVQGFEMEVLNGINWAHPPQWIVVEDDLGKTFELLKFFHEKNFRWVAGGHDKLFMMV